MFLIINLICLSLIEGGCPWGRMRNGAPREALQSKRVSAGQTNKLIEINLLDLVWPSQSGSNNSILLSFHSWNGEEWVLMELELRGRWSCKLITNNQTNSMRGLLSFVCCCFLALRSIPFVFFFFISASSFKRKTKEIKDVCWFGLIVFFLVRSNWACRPITPHKRNQPNQLHSHCPPALHWMKFHFIHKPLGAAQLSLFIQFSINLPILKEKIDGIEEESWAAAKQTHHSFHSKIKFIFSCLSLCVSFNYCYNIISLPPLENKSKPQIKPNWVAWFVGVACFLFLPFYESMKWNEIDSVDWPFIQLRWNNGQLVIGCVPNQPHFIPLSLILLPFL